VFNKKRKRPLVEKQTEKKKKPTILGINLVPTRLESGCSIKHVRKHASSGKDPKYANLISNWLANMQGS